MNEPERTELARLREQQARLEMELKLLSQQLALFEQRFAHTTTAERLPTSPLLPKSEPVRPPVSSAPTSQSIPASTPVPPPLVQRPVLTQSTGVAKGELQ